MLLKNRRGISIVIGYVLLITVSIVMSVVVFQWLRTYVPKEAPKCSEGTSFLIREISYNCTSQKLSIDVKNNGKFSINGYFIHASDKSDLEQLAIIDLSPKLVVQEHETIYLSSVEFSNVEENNLLPGGTHSSLFNVADYCPCDAPGKTLTKIEIIPTRIQDIEGKKRFVICSDAKIEETLTCH
ncbi:hypothetical protein A3K82_01900 [Candidatus Pacearchaeota archaeon RBG_19FT_COMBO_34_9]|nr:MAG: hypothetical protein A3K82_01900 [Candidatus Pacearchaeota archaeon RBG_19FT_COMBO_34_9]OGJ16735.1 MAG: hypothetical protein A3K74_00775 [Candidatus Pacearchaeota archaeon RBG_13_33_26]